MYNRCKKGSMCGCVLLLIYIPYFTGANIFLSRDSVKLGDFGLSVQLKNVNKTQPNEIKHQRGTIRKLPCLIDHPNLQERMLSPSLRHSFFFSPVPHGLFLVSIHGSRGHPQTEYGPGHGRVGHWVRRRGDDNQQGKKINSKFPINSDKKKNKFVQL